MTSPVEMTWDGDVVELVIDRPEARNAVSRAVMDDLDAAIAEVERSRARVVVLRGSGDRVFVSGGDLKELARLRAFDQAHEMAVRMRGVLDRLANLAVPVVAAVNGDAYGGGGEVALACDIRVAADDVRMGFTQSQLGIMPAWGGIERLVTLVGRGRALYLLATGHLLSGQDLVGWGLVEEMVPRSDFERRWRELTHALCEVPRDALAGIKAVADATVPWVRPASEVLATEAFARTWVADEHWELADRADERRRRAAATTSPA